MNRLDLHDATLDLVVFDLPTHTVTAMFRGSPTMPGRFSLTFREVTDMRIPAKQPWGPSVSVLALHDLGAGRFELELQSGDTIAIRAADLEPVLQRGTVDRRRDGKH